MVYIKKSVYVWVATLKYIHAMTGTLEPLVANIGSILKLVLFAEKYSKQLSLHY